MGYTGDKKRKYQREWVARRRQQWIDLNSPCKKCGSFENLEVDHIDPNSKKHPVGTLWSRTKEVMGRELSKCQVLCNKCHLKKTTKELKKSVTHGTNSGYVWYKCRCRRCKNAHNKVNSRWRSLFDAHANHRLRMACSGNNARLFL